MKTIYKHKYMNALCEIIEPTKKGFKVFFCEVGKKPKTMFFSDIDFHKEKGIFIKIEGTETNSKN